MNPVEKYRSLAADSAARWSSKLAVPELTANLVLAVMQQENPRADPRLVVPEPNGRRSYGLMSVEDSTAAKYGIADPTELWDPQLGVEIGTRELGNQLVRYGGKVPSAVAAYNAGTARFTEQETFTNQPYVDRVLGFLRALESGAQAAAPWVPWVILGILGIALVAATRGEE